MDPLTIALISAGIAAASSGIQAGVSSKKTREAAEGVFTDEEARRLQDLQDMQERGELGLTEAQELALQAQFRQQAAAQSRATQAERLAQQAGSLASARDVFLQEAAAQAARQTTTAQQNLERLQAEQAAQQAQEAEMQRLLLARSQAAQIMAGAPSAGAAVATGIAEQTPEILGAAMEQQLLLERDAALLEAYQTDQITAYDLMISGAM